MQTTLAEAASERCMRVPAGELVVRQLPDGNRVAVSMVVPTYNERSNLAEVVDLLQKAIGSQVGDSYEILVVDDNSPDGTWEVAATIAAKNPHVVALRRVEERGLATAVIRGWQAARGEWLGVIDADLQHPPEVTGRLIAAMKQDADLTVASRDAEGGGTGDWSVLRQWISRASRAMGKILLPGPLGMVSDPMTGFFLVRRSAIQDVVLSPRGYKILVEVLARTRIRKVVEVGYVFRPRQRGQSKASPRIFLEYMRQLLSLRAAIRSLPSQSCRQRENEC